MDFKSLTDSVASKVSQTMVGDGHYMSNNVSAMQHDVRDADPVHEGVLCAMASMPWVMKPCHRPHITEYIATRVEAPHAANN